MWLAPDLHGTFPNNVTTLQADILLGIAFPGVARAGTRSSAL
jgi:hypothetical protein